MVTDTRVVSVGVDYITLGWEPPPKEPGVHIESYQVRYSVGKSGINENASTIDVGNKLNLTLNGLQPQTQYHFQVSLC